MIDHPAALNVQITCEGHSIGEWPDHEVVLRFSEDGDLMEIDQPSTRDTGLQTQYVTQTINRDTRSEVACCIWAAGLDWLKHNRSEIESRLSRPKRAEPGRPHYGSWATGSRI